MKTLALLTMSAAVLASTTLFSSAFAQDTTRPDAVPSYQQQVAPQQTQATNSSEGPATMGSSMSGHRPTTSSNMAYPQSCAGPVSFCNVYFGS
ncbi:hypothetical protein GCM10027093_38390 [Paraburkholderia jirisanensis]